MARCEYCGGNAENCNCDDTIEWFSFDTFPPEPGQKCRVKRVQIFDAVYMPKWDEEFHMLNFIESENIAWRPLYQRKSDVWI